MEHAPLPRGWQRHELGELVSFASGGTPSKEKADYWNGDIPWVTAKDMKTFELTSSELKITPDGLRHGGRTVPANSLLVLVRGMTLMKDVPICLTAREMAFNQDVRGLQVKGKVEPRFLAYALVAQKEQLRGLVNIAGHGTGRLSTEALAEHPIIFPASREEQSAIAAVLSAWDRPIGQTTALIAAKARLKQGLMQQLFGEAAHSQRQLESKLCHLGDVAAESTRRNVGGLDAEAVYSVTKANGMVPMHEDIVGSDITRYKLVRPKAFAYNPMRINIGSIARWEGGSEVLVSPDYVVFECSAELDPDYLNHFRRGHVWDSYVKRSGDGSVRVRIYFDHLSRMRIRLPGIQEQRRIAKVLDAANAELRLLERKLKALKQQKRGLMQQLLTGQVRVPKSLLKKGAQS